MTDRTHTLNIEKEMSKVRDNLMVIGTALKTRILEAIGND